MSYNPLISEVSSHVRFSVSKSDMKKRVESLIERGYLERDATDPEKFNYLAWHDKNINKTIYTFKTNIKNDCFLFIYIQYIKYCEVLCYSSTALLKQCLNKNELRKVKEWNQIKNSLLDK